MLFLLFLFLSFLLINHRQWIRTATSSIDVVKIIKLIWIANRCSTRRLVRPDTMEASHARLARGHWSLGVDLLTDHGVWPLVRGSCRILYPCAPIVIQVVQVVIFCWYVAHEALILHLLLLLLRDLPCLSWLIVRSSSVKRRSVEESHAITLVDAGGDLLR